MKTESTDNKVNSRRKFLQKSSAGVVIASLPAKSVWANGIAGSIVASGHSSDWATRNNVALRCFSNSEITSIFGSALYNDYFVGKSPLGIGVTFNAATSTMVNIFTQVEGTSSADEWMIMLLANAIVDGDVAYGVICPVVGPNGYSDILAYSEALYSTAAGNMNFASEAATMFSC